MSLKENEVIISIFEPEDSYSALFSARKLAEKVGFDRTNEVLFATVVSELATNIFRYAGTGQIILRIIQTKEKIGIEVKAVDKGPGINNVDIAMEDNFTTSKNSLGLGLSSLKRIMDEFIIHSNATDGTRIIARKWSK